MTTMSFVTTSVVIAQQPRILYQRIGRKHLAKKLVSPCARTVALPVSRPSLSLKATEDGEGSSIPSTNSTSVLEDSEYVQDQKDIKDILEILEVLRVKRDFLFNEVRLALLIEDPRAAERRRELNIDDESGCTREEIVEALQEVYDGKNPRDRMALRAVADELRNWPRLDDDEPASAPDRRAASPYAKVTNTGVSPEVAARRAGLATDWDSALDVAEEEEKSLGEVLPPWVGYGVLYGISVVPIVIGVVVVIILFLNSLQ